MGPGSASDSNLLWRYDRHKEIVRQGPPPIRQRMSIPLSGSTSDSSAVAPVRAHRGAPASPHGRMLLALFAAAVATNAFVLFVVEPMFAKIVLPRFGGTSSVWTTCMLFYQTALLAGYAYAHTVARITGTRKQVLLHLGLLGIAAVVLPVGIPAGWSPDPGRAPAADLLFLLVRALGAPFLMLAAGAPLLQAWFHRAQVDRNPYVLYAASNFASVIALLAYPFVIEPWLTLGAQRSAWTAAYGLVVALVAACGLVAWQSREQPGAAPAKSRASATNVGLIDRLRWIALSMVPSSLVLGVTTHLTTDLAPIPLLWIVPLALYLLTFVIAFSERGVRLQRPTLVVQAYLLTGMAALYLLGAALPGRFGYALHLGTFFATALICHLRLYAVRPEPSRLTEYYLWIAFGGMLGGAFNVLVAPAVFTTIAEYPLALVAAAALRPPAARGRMWIDIAAPALLAVLLLGASGWIGQDRGGTRIIEALVVCGAATAMFSFRARRLRFALAFGAMALIGARAQWSGVESLLATRSFYGAYRVVIDPDQGTHVLYSGNTVHGSQATSAPRVPLMYYHPDGPLGDVFALRAPANRWRVGVVGLGAGASAAYARRGERWTFYEIDPTVARIARDSTLFTYLRDAPAAQRIVLGDARLSLAREPSGSFDLLVIDAFSSDAVPTHLLTREALALYRTTLGPGGVIAWHISNKYVDLRPVLANLAMDAGLAAFLRDDTRLASPEPGTVGRSASVWAVMTGSTGHASWFDSDSAWRRLEANKHARIWTDDFTSVAGILR